MTDESRIGTEETLLKERAINTRYNRLVKRLLTGEFLAMGLGVAIFIGTGLFGIVNYSKNPYKSLPAVVEHSEIQQCLRDIEENGYSLRQIAKRNPDLIDLSKIEPYINRLERELGTLENHSDYVSYHHWKQENIDSYFKYGELALGLGFSGGLLACAGLFIVENKKNKELQAIQERV